jgi:hypothetical protein
MFWKSFCRARRAIRALPASAPLQPACFGATLLDAVSAAGQGGPSERERNQVLRPRNQWPLRLAGSLFGLGCCAIGLFSIFGGGDQLPELNRERAFGFGIVAIVVGLVALIGSLMSDAHALWYCMPRRWRPFREDVLGASEAWKPPAPRRIGPRDDASADP